MARRSPPREENGSVAGFRAAELRIAREAEPELAAVPFRPSVVTGGAVVVEGEAGPVSFDPETGD